MNMTYPSDLTDPEWARLQRHLSSEIPCRRWAHHSLRTVLDAIFYLLWTGGPWGYRDLLAERDSGWALLQALDDQALVAQCLLDWYDGGPRPTYDDTEYMDALERIRDWLADALIPFNRRAVNAALRTQRKEWPPARSFSVLPHG